MRLTLQDDADMVALLVARGAKVNLQLHHGDTSLHVAIVHEASRAVKELLAKGADLNMQDGDGVTGIELAERRALPHILALLVGAAVQQEADASFARADRIKEQRIATRKVGHCIMLNCDVTDSQVPS